VCSSDLPADASAEATAPCALGDVVRMGSRGLRAVIRWALLGGARGGVVWVVSDVDESCMFKG